MPLETVERDVERAVRERGELGHAHIDADRTALWQGQRHFPLGLDANVPLATRLIDGDVLHYPQHIPTVAVAQPAQLGQKETAVGLIELDLFRVGIAKALGLPFLLEAWEVGPLGEEVAVGPLQILERLLQRMHRRIGQPRGFHAVSPLGEQLAQPGIAELLLAFFVARFLQCQRLVEREPARASEAAHLPLLLAVWPEFKFEGLKSLHSSIILLVYEQ